MNNIAPLIQKNLAGEPVGLPCFCTANEQVLHAIFKYAAKHNTPTVVEATCNQVNQDGGYTGMTAADFAQWMQSLGNEYGVAHDNIILGGDHLGPNPWRHLPAEQAMEKACVLVRDYAAAGFRKIHLDASMACAREPTPSFETVAERAAQLCKVAEQAAPNPEELMYIIGTEVPIPGGETDDMDELSITSADRLNDTIETHREAFKRANLDDAWQKIVSVVTQPGVDFSHTTVHNFEPRKAIHLAQQIKQFSNITFEAHSTDYQPTTALADLVAKHFFFLKVGPELTFRMREAAFALTSIEHHLKKKSQQSELIATLAKAMNDNPEHWTPYYRGDANTIEQLKMFSYSDRIRYYWTVPEVQASLKLLYKNLSDAQLPSTIISQYFPARDMGALAASAEQLVTDHVELCIGRYYDACGHTTQSND